MCERIGECVSVFVMESQGQNIEKYSASRYAFKFLRHVQGMFVKAIKHNMVSYQRKITAALVVQP